MTQSVSWLKHALVIMIIALVASPAAFAQSFRGAIGGTVTDSSGGVVPGAEVKVTGTENGLARSATTNDLGAYSVTELPGGSYSVAVSKTGYKAVSLKGVVVTVGTEQRVDARLAAGSTSEVVTVNADVPLIESTSNTMGGTIEALHLQEIPINGRDYTKVLVMTPGATGDGGGGSDSPGSFGLFSSNGNRGRSNNYLLDGTDMNDGYRNLPVLNQGGVFGTPSTVLPVDALAEIPVLSNVEPEYGRNSGAVVNMVTKSGTNEWHGSGYEFFRNSALDARNFFNTVGSPQSQFHNNQFGGSLGGPIYKDKTFFFTSYEGQRESGGQPETIVVPSQAQIAAAGGATDPVIINLLALNPWGTLPAVGNGTAGPTGSATVNTSVPFFNDANTYIAKIDQHLGQNLLTGRYLYGHSDQSFPFGLVGGGVTPGYNTTTPTTVNLVSLSYTHIITPKLLGELRFGFNRFTESFHPQDNTFDPASIGLNTGATAQDFGLPQISVGGLSILGSNVANPRGRTDQNWQLDGNMTWIHGRHNWKAGYEFRRTTVDEFFNAGHRSAISFDDFSSFLAGNVGGGHQAFGDTRRNMYQDNNSFYLQDNWRIMPRVTFNYGVRWDYFGVIGEAHNLFSLLGNDGFVHNVNQLYPKDYNNFAPRASVAWDIFGTGKTVARAGWGIYYDGFSQDFFGGQLPWPTFNAGPAFNDVGPRPVSFSFGPALGGYSAAPCGAGTIPIPNTAQCAPALFTGISDDAFTVNQHTRTPFVHNFNINVEQQLGRKASVQIGYVGSLGRKLFTYNDINQSLPNTLEAKANPNYFYILDFDSAATSNYHSLQTSLRLRDMHGLTSTVNYTYSHAIDDASDGQDYVPNATQPDNSFCRRCERASSNFDQRHHLTWTMHYALPSGHSWKPLTSGWSMDNVVTLSAGQPVNVNYMFEGDFNGSAEFYGRPDIIGNPFAGTSALGSGYAINAAAFQVPCNYDPNDPNGFGCDAANPNQHFGSLGRNALNGPTFKNWDFSVVKDTKLTERINMQLRADFFNILNHPNFASPLWPGFEVDMAANGLTTGAPLGDPSNGRGIGFIQSTSTPDVGLGNPFLGSGGSRNIQFAVRFSF
ncbi:MAG: TonB-dependent receptor domain-containing protein [Terriglobales bacterium]